MNDNLRLGQNVPVLLLFALTIFNFTIQETRSENVITYEKDANIHIAFAIFGGYEGRRTRAEIDSSGLLTEEVNALRQMINDAQFFDLPETITSSKQRCFDCYQYEITIES